MSADATYNWKGGIKRYFNSNVFYGYHPENEPDDMNRKNIDPMFVSPGSGGFGIHSVSGYMLKPGSPCIDAGISIPGNGGRDYRGNELNDGKPDIGAFEFSKSFHF